MNPRVSRSSALASKATGYPIAKVAAKLAVGYTLDEIPNDLTGTTPASFEPTLDYVVVKVPRFAFEKFPGADTTLGTQMKSVGEAMGIGRHVHRGARESAALARARRRRGRRLALARLSCPKGLHPWFTAELERLRLGSHEPQRPGRRRLAAAEALGHSDAAVARPASGPRDARAARRSWGCSRLPAGRLLRGRGRGSLELLLLDLGRGRTRTTPSGGRSSSSASGPNRIGQGIEFDYCCVHAAQSFRALGYEAVMVNCNPETVSTDYDTSDRLYFEPLGVEEVLGDLRARAAGRRRDPVRRPDAAQARARDRGRGLPDPGHALRGGRPRRRTASASRRSATELGIARAAVGDGRRARTRPSRSRSGSAIPVLVRPSYVLGGRSDAGLLRRRGGARRPLRVPAAGCSSTASSRTRSRSTSTRSATGTRPSSPRSCSTSRRRASTRATPAACCRRRR